MAKTCGYAEVATFIFTDMCERIEGRRAVLPELGGFLLSVDHKLRMEGIGSDIPTCWYIDGEEVAFDGIGYVEHIFRNGAEDVAYVGDLHDVDADDPVVSAIVDFARNHGSVQIPPQEPPLPFLGDFPAFIRMLKNASAGSSVSRHEVEDAFLSVMGEFPEGISSEDCRNKEFSAVFLEALRNGGSVDGLIEMSEYWWAHFCHRVRLDGRCHRNINPEAIRVWHSVLELEDDRMDLNLGNYAHDFCNGSSDPLIRQLIARREANLEELEKALEELCF